jgi:two-component system sensor histidine kinase YesM
LNYIQADYLAEADNNGTEGFSIIDEKGTMVLKTDYFYNNKIDNLKWCINDINFNQAKGNFTSVYQGTKMQVIYKKLTYTGLTSVYMIPYDAMQKEIKKLNTRNTVLIIIFIIVFILIAAFLSFTIIYPIKYLSSQMRKVTYQNLDMEVKVRAGDEIGQLTESFNTMLRNIRKLVNEIRINEHEKKELHLEVLQNQINPHFLLNTLNAIKWNAYVNGIQNVGDMIATLGGLLETIIDRKSECVLIREEISYIKNYITLMSFRYNQDISVTYDIEQQVLDYYTLKFILQPK